MKKKSNTPKTKTYMIGQLLIQTDWYEIEASSAKEALEIYNKQPGLCISIGSTSGWSGPRKKSAFVSKKR